MTKNQVRYTQIPKNDKEGSEYDEKYPYEGVKGMGVARISEDIQKNLSIMEKINVKYLGTLEQLLAKILMEN